MKTAIIMEIQNGVAVLLQPSGIFTQHKACPEWEVGNVVAVDAPRKPRAVFFRRLAVAAACLILLAVAGFGGYTLMFETAAVISIDINPSVELGLNRMGRVVSATAYNDDGNVLLAGLQLKGQPYKAAVATLLQSETMQPYLASNVVLEFSVFAKNDAQGMVEYLNTQGESITAQYPQLQVHCNNVGQEVVQQAHEHGISPGKMRALLELQQLDPSIDIQAYSHHSMADIHRLIREHHASDSSQAQGNGAGNGHGGRDDGKSGAQQNGHGRNDDSSSPSGNGSSQQRGHGRNDDSSSRSGGDGSSQQSGNGNGHHGDGEHRRSG